VSKDLRARRARVVSSGHAFLESPRWHDGDLYASDFHKHEVLRWAGGEGSPEVIATVPQQPSGLGWSVDGDLLVVSMVDRRLLRVRDGELEEVAALGPVAPWHCNDMIVDAHGRAYVGNFGWDEQVDPRIRPTVLQRVDPDGTATVVADGLVSPNGMAITPGGRTLLIAETLAARITAFDIAPDGALGGRRVWAGWSDDEFEDLDEALGAGVPLPDGIALDAEGAIWFGDCHGRGAVRVAPGGEILEEVPSSPHATFAVALGGQHRRTLFMCTTFPYRSGNPRVDHQGAMRSCRVEVPGA
jgi:sugar lactone lactonase YvrE